MTRTSTGMLIDRLIEKATDKVIDRVIDRVKGEMTNRVIVRMKRETNGKLIDQKTTIPKEVENNNKTVETIMRKASVEVEEVEVVEKMLLTSINRLLKGNNNSSSREKIEINNRNVRRQSKSLSLK